MKEAGIRVGVITNHNKFDEPEFKALRKAAKKKSILLLPGVELSVKDGSNGIHTLIVFHPSWVKNIEGFNHIQSFLNSAFAGQSNFENENGRSNHDLDETVRQLDQFGRDYFIVFAHVEENNGLWGGLSGGRLGELKEPVKSRCLGFQKVRTRDDRDKVQQQLAGWYPAEVEGCDCKSVEQIGQGQLETHVKIGSFCKD